MKKSIKEINLNLINEEQLEDQTWQIIGILRDELLKHNLPASIADDFSNCLVTWFSFSGSVAGFGLSAKKSGKLLIDAAMGEFLNHLKKDLPDQVFIQYQSALKICAETIKALWHLPEFEVLLKKRGLNNPFLRFHKELFTEPCYRFWAVSGHFAMRNFLKMMLASGTKAESIMNNLETTVTAFKKVSRILPQAVWQGKPISEYRGTQFQSVLEINILERLPLSEPERLNYEKLIGYVVRALYPSIRKKEFSPREMSQTDAGVPRPKRVFSDPEEDKLESFKKSVKRSMYEKRDQVEDESEMDEESIFPVDFDLTDEQETVNYIKNVVGSRSYKGKMEVRRDRNPLEINVCPLFQVADLLLFCGMRQEGENDDEYQHNQINRMGLVYLAITTGRSILDLATIIDYPTLEEMPKDARLGFHCGSIYARRPNLDDIPVSFQKLFQENDRQIILEQLDLRKKTYIVPEMIYPLPLTPDQASWIERILKCREQKSFSQKLPRNKPLFTLLRSGTLNPWTKEDTNQLLNQFHFFHHQSAPSAKKLTEKDLVDFL